MCQFWLKHQLGSLSWFYVSSVCRWGLFGENAHWLGGWSLDPSSGQGLPLGVGGPWDHLRTRVGHRVPHGTLGWLDQEYPLASIGAFSDPLRICDQLAKAGFQSPSLCQETKVGILRFQQLQVLLPKEHRAVQANHPAQKEVVTSISQSGWVSGALTGEGFWLDAFGRGTRHPTTWERWIQQKRSWTPSAILLKWRTGQVQMETCMIA